MVSLSLCPQLIRIVGLREDLCAAAVLLEDERPRNSNSETQPAGRRGFELVIGTDEPGLVGKHDRLYAVAQLELHEDPSNVSLDGRLLNYQLGGNLTV